MTFADAIRTCLSKYATLDGRAGRAEYWWFTLFNVIGSMVTNVLDQSLFGSPDVGIIGAIWGIALLLPSVAVGARRLHDRDRSAWWLLLYLVPIVGWIVLVVWFVGRGSPEPNRFGPPPTA